MKTFNDFEKLGDDEQKRRDFIYSAIMEHKSSTQYKNAAIAYEYFCHRNVTITQLQKWWCEFTGERMPDTISPNHKCKSNYFQQFVTQEVEHLLSNGISFEGDKQRKKDGQKNPNTTKDKLGGNSIDEKVSTAAEGALWGGVSFVFYNYDQVAVFDILEFVPLWDEEDGSLKAGIRFWQIDNDKPMRVTLYEIEGYTNYYFNASQKAEIIGEKQKYKQTFRTSEFSGEEIIDGKNYDTFPIVPYWGNPEHQSEFEGLREYIDCYDLIMSGFANDLDEASQIYWIIQNSGAMDEADIAKFRDIIRRTKVVRDETGQADISAQTIEVPYNAREVALSRLHKDLFDMYGALDTREIAAGNVTATAIRAAYENLRMKCDRFERCTTECIRALLKLAGIDDSPSYTRSSIINQLEEISIVLQSAPYLSDDYVTRKLLTILGDIDQYESVMQARMADDMSRFDGGETA